MLWGERILIGGARVIRGRGCFILGKDEEGKDKKILDILKNIDFQMVKQLTHILQLLWVYIQW
jgi:hypothetical protein